MGMLPVKMSCLLMDRTSHRNMDLIQWPVLQRYNARDVIMVSLYES